MNTLFPLITEYNEEFKEYYTYRQIYFKWNINSEAYRLHKQYTDFPDSSYYWVYPKGEEPKERHVLFGTYYIQHEIWKHQFPATCEDKKFLIVPLWNAGMGSVIHVLTQSLAWTISTDRIMIAKPLFRTYWGDPEFCDADNQSMLCYLEPLTNCSISEKDIRLAFNRGKVHFSHNHAHVHNYTLVSQYPQIQYIFTAYNYYLNQQVPSFIHSFLSYSDMTNYERWYWRIQASAFITRLNEKTMNWIHDYEKENCNECKNEYDFTLNIRHGDKGSEMGLIEADVYKEAIKIITSLGLKKDYTVYVNADDQESVDAIYKLPYNVASFNQSRYNYGYEQNKEEKHVGLISFSNLLHQIRGDHCVGTIGSNWSRLIYELKMTVGLKSDGFIFEVGNEACITLAHCTMKRRILSTKWR